MAADRFGFDWYGGVRGSVRTGMAARAGGRCHSGRAGRSGRSRRSPAQLCMRNNPARRRRQRRGGARRRRCRPCRKLCRTRPGEEYSSGRGTVAAGGRCRRGRKFLVAFRQALCRGPGHRQCRRRREPVGHRRRRSLRIRRHPRRGARKQASRDGRGYRPAGAGSRRRGAGGDGGDLCLRRRRRAGARRAHHGQGRPQGRPTGRGAHGMGRPLRARNGRRADAAERGGVRFGDAAGPDPHRDQGRVSCREGGRAGASRQGCRARRRKGRHSRRAGTR